MEQYHDLELMAELVRRNRDRLRSAPKSRHYASPHTEVCMGIGNDHTADITMGDEDLAALMEHMREPSLSYQAMRLCHAIEALPAGERATDASLMASDLAAFLRQHFG